MSLRNLSSIMIFLNALLVITPIFSTHVSAREIMMTPTNGFAEQVLISVNCSRATLTTSISLMSSDTTFVHFPEGVSMMNPNFALCETVSVSVNPMGSVLWYLFDTTNTAAAKGYADAITPSMNGAFSWTFSFFSVGLTDSKTNVTYTAAGPQSVGLYYINTLKPSCLKSDLAGFSDTIPNLLSVLPTQSLAGISAHKTSGGYAWEYVFFAGYFEMQIPTGSGYTVNVLDLLGTTFLAPSSYAYAGAYYNSIVAVLVEPQTTVSFVSCTPNQIFTQYSERGWYVIPPNPIFFIKTLTGIFYFGNDATPVTVLTFTFSGTIIPEFSSLSLIIAVMVCTTTVGVIAFKKRFVKNPNRFIRHPYNK